MNYPLSPDDLRTIADVLDKINSVLFNADGDFTLGEGIGNFSIPLLRPDAYDAEDIVGYAVLDGGWAGFSNTPSPTVA